MHRITLLMVTALAALTTACGDGSSSSAYPRDAELRLNHMQVLGTHNSYHVQPMEALFTAIRGFSAALAESWEYTHLPLDEQFATQGIRQIELDVFADPQGGLYADRAGARLVGSETGAGIPELHGPGFKVLHVQDLDFETRCLRFIDCLEIVRTWSDANPGHAPLLILIEAKDEPIPDPGLGFVIPHEIGTNELDALDAEILSVIPLEKIITPDEVRAGRATLEEAVLELGWPTLGESRGRLLFGLDNGGRIRDAYLAGHPSLAGRILFTPSSPGEPDAAFFKLNDPIGDHERIRAAVAAGYIVRTRADGDTVEARTGDTTQRDAALASGAQFVSTDYPVPDTRFGTGYQATIPEGMPGRCNPVSAPPGCTSLDIENPAHLEER